MSKTITFSELRRVKDNLPSGSMQRIADELGIPSDTVRNYFGAQNYDKGGQSVGIHLEPGPDGGYVILDDLTIWEMAMQILEEKKIPVTNE